jgi:hypothetical protein
VAERPGRRATPEVFSLRSLFCVRKKLPSFFPLRSIAATAPTVTSVGNVATGGNADTPPPTPPPQQVPPPQKGTEEDPIVLE